ncbi:IclR family transcriptional regulator C-terminal domain-containing protein [Streptomyces sp. NPDC004610]|uniref:IclR family transcriptional regulator domain-containing protein n=1 Tax=unclassified Streptomyces TaxID=2593676 RepID=UPI0033B499B0
MTEARQPVGDAANEPESGPESGGDRAAFIQTLARGLDVLGAFDSEHPSMTLSQVAERAGIPRAAARRFLMTLQALGFVRSYGRQFALTPQVLKFGFSYLATLRLPDVARPHLHAFGREAGESVALAILDGDSVVFVAVAAAEGRFLSVTLDLGMRLPWYVASSGRVLVACSPEEVRERLLTSADLVPFTATTTTDPDELRPLLAQVRENGFAVVDDELEDGIHAIAVPVHDEDGTVIAALNVVSVTRGLSIEQQTERLLPLLRDTAAAIERDYRASNHGQ